MKISFKNFLWIFGLHCGPQLLWQQFLTRQYSSLLHCINPKKYLKTRLTNFSKKCCLCELAITSTFEICKIYSVSHFTKISSLYFRLHRSRLVTKIWHKMRYALYCLGIFNSRFPDLSINYPAKLPATSLNLNFLGKM